MLALIVFPPDTEGETNERQVYYSDMFVRPRAVPGLPDGLYEVDGTYVRSVGMSAIPEGIEHLLRDAAREQGIDEELFVRVAWCESGFKLGIHNVASTASGIFQFLDSTFNSQMNKYGLTGDKDSEIQILLASLMIRDGGIGHWNASRTCWQR